MRARGRRVPDGLVVAAALGARRDEAAAGPTTLVHPVAMETDPQCVTPVVTLDIASWRPGRRAAGRRAPRARRSRAGGVLVLPQLAFAHVAPTSSASSTCAGPTARRRTSASRARRSRARAASAADLAALGGDGRALRGRRDRAGRRALSRAMRRTSSARARATGRTAPRAAPCRGARTTRGCTSTRFRRGPIAASASCACSAT